MYSEVSLHALILQKNKWHVVTIFEDEPNCWQLFHLQLLLIACYFDLFDGFTSVSFDMLMTGFYCYDSHKINKAVAYCWSIGNNSSYFILPTAQTQPSHWHAYKRKYVYSQVLTIIVISIPQTNPNFIFLYTTYFYTHFAPFSSLTSTQTIKTPKVYWQKINPLSESVLEHVYLILHLNMTLWYLFITAMRNIFCEPNILWYIP